MKKIFIITGEHSGDLHASYVVKELKKQNPGVEIEAIGGENLQREGVKLFADHSKMSVMGINLIDLINHIKLGIDIRNYLRDVYKPDLVLLIDYGGFNLRIAGELKKCGIDCYYYICPQIWASRKNRIEKIKKYIKKALLIFPFEEKIYHEKGIDAEYVGHPLASQLNRHFPKSDFVEKNGLNPDKKIVGIFPGSRKMELNYLFPIFVEAANLIAKKNPNVQFCIGQAPNIKDELFNKYIEKYDLGDIKLIKNQNHELLANSDAVILASGTITLEASIFKTPMVVSYKAPQWMYFVYLMVRHLDMISLPNIIADKKIVKEFVQNNAKAELIAEEILNLLNNPGVMIDELSKIETKLSGKIASKEVARNINDYLIRKK